MEELKKLEKITSPDNRTTFFVIVNRETGQKREYRIEDLYEELNLIELNEAVPEDVRSQFNVARNVCLYSWFCYSFHNVSCLMAYSTIEMALRIRLGKPEHKSSLRTLLNEALAKGLLKDKLLPEAIADLRNRAAHGSLMNGPWSVQILRLCAETINQLFTSTEYTTA